MSRHITQMSIEDADHYTEEEHIKIIESCLPHERDARAKGVPQSGSGPIFYIAEDQFK